MANARGKQVDTTYLSLDTAEERGFIHRDYIAHCLRWSHVVKNLYARKSYESARILDIGCGRELPLAKLLYSSRLAPAAYFGVDYGPLEDAAVELFHTGKFTPVVYERTDFCDITLQDLGAEPVSWVTCFEVLEHVEPRHMVRMLRHAATLTTPDARFFFSTPCYNWQDVAANHVNEITYEALGAIFEALGYEVVGVYGTFASIRDYEHKLNQHTANLSVIFNQLRDYYDVNFLSCIFAPLFPAESRNCLWELKKNPDPNMEGAFKRLEYCKAPWSSSANWEHFKEVYDAQV
jgi:2-polyprenyl-3-methyl-5-hydroxy-6-metoxy-1,4-benzoquinol methylase